MARARAIYTGLAVAALAGALFFGGACSEKPAEPAAQSDLPALPEIVPENFVPEIRERIRTAYQAAQAAPSSAEANGALGQLLHAHSQFQLAEALYRRALALAPDEFSWSYYLGIVLSRQAKHQDAAEALREAVRKDASYLPARLRLADSLLALRKHEEAGELYRGAISQSPSSAEGHYGLGRVLVAQGETKAGVEQLVQACELAPNFGPAHYALALAYRDLGDSVRSARQLELYEQDKLGGPRPNDPLMAVVNSLKTGAPDELKRGVEFEKLGRIEEAIAAHEKAVELDPDFEQAHVNLVILYGRQGNVAKAELHYKAAIDANPDQADLHYNFGVMAFQAGRMKEAERAFKLALDLNPSYPQAHNNMGQMLERQGRIDEAIGHYRKAIENRPDYRLAHFHLGRMLIAKGRGQEAIAEFEKTLEPVDEETPQYMYGLAAAYARAGDRQKAAELAEKSRLLAERFNQPQLAAKIAEDMKKLRR